MQIALMSPFNNMPHCTLDESEKCGPSVKDADSIRITVSPFRGEHLTLDVALLSQCASINSAPRLIHNSSKLSRRRLRVHQICVPSKHGHSNKILRSDFFSRDQLVSGNIHRAHSPPHSPPHSPTLLLSPRKGGSRRSSQGPTNYDAVRQRRESSCGGTMSGNADDDKCNGEHEVNPEVVDAAPTTATCNNKPPVVEPDHPQSANDVTVLLPGAGKEGSRHSVQAGVDREASETGAYSVDEGRARKEDEGEIDQEGGGFWEHAEQALVALLSVAKKADDGFESTPYVMDALFQHEEEHSIIAKARQNENSTDDMEEDKNMPEQEQEEEEESARFSAISDLSFLRSQVAAAREEQLLEELEAMALENDRLRQVVAISAALLRDSSSNKSSGASESDGSSSSSHEHVEKLQEEVARLKEERVRERKEIESLRAQLRLADQRRYIAASGLWLKTAALQGGLADIATEIAALKSSNSHPNSHPDSHPNLHLDSHPDAHPDSHPDSHPNSHPDAEPGAKSEPTSARPPQKHPRPPPSNAPFVPILPVNTAFSLRAASVPQRGPPPSSGPQRGTASPACRLQLESDHSFLSPRSTSSPNAGPARMRYC